MRKIVVLDITSRNAEQYNPSLCRELASHLDSGCIVLMAPSHYGPIIGYKYKKLISFVPESKMTSVSRIKRILRAIETLINYFYVLVYLLCKKPDLLHIQWLPFLEILNIEKYILACFKIVSPKTALFLTVHNIYPHDIGAKRKKSYTERFKKIDSYIDGYMVHLNSSRKELSTAFNIDERKIHIAYHGIYKAEGYEIDAKSANKSENFSIIMYGIQKRYKGADILVDAIQLLPEKYQKRISALIMGRTDPGLYLEYYEKANKLNIKWVNRYVTDIELYSGISNADLIILPYRSISQSGVLLLALSYHKPILTSDLPSFRETLEGYPSDYFFEANNPQALADVLKRYIDNTVNLKLITNVINNLNIKYSWANTAKATLKAYNSVINEELSWKN